MDAETAVGRELPVFGATAPGDRDGLRRGIVAAGVAEPLAGEVTALMPIAFGRELAGKKRPWWRFGGCER